MTEETSPASTEAPSSATSPGLSVPRYHIRPRHGWLNDANGLCRIDGTWHVFFQHYAERPVHRQICWGHVSSRDLVHWRHHPVAFGPTPGGPDEFGCWSGVFFPGLDRPAVAYTGVRRAPEDDPGGSTVCVHRAAADDAGALERWEDPVVVADTPGVDGILVMRDPFLFERHGRRWALLGAGLADGTPAVLLFDARDPERWSYAGLFATGRDLLGGALPRADIWECPQLVPVGESWLLVLSLQLEGQLGGVEGVLGAVVDDEAGRPAFDARDHARIDDGDDFYAPQAMVDEHGVLMFGWIRQAPQVDAAVRVAGCLTLPRRIALSGDAVRITPDPAIDAAIDAGFAAGPNPPGHADSIHCTTADLPNSCRIDIVDTPATLAGAGRPVALPVNSRVYLDGNVAEIYPETGMPATYRLTDERGWRVTGGVRTSPWVGPSMPE